MALVLGSAHLTDEEFLQAFAACRIANDQFRHADHLRLAWLMLHRAPFDVALSEVRAAIQKFATHHGATQLYHETITIAWMRLLVTHHEETFAQFLSKNEERLKQNLLHRFWTPELLASQPAKTHWVAPDLGPLPR